MGVPCTPDAVVIIASESVQLLLITRSSELQDLYIDGIGAAIGLLLAEGFGRLRGIGRA